MSMNMIDKRKITREERIKQYDQAKSAHKLKNRSSKNVLTLAHVNLDTSRIYRSYSRLALEQMRSNGDFYADMELTRRDKKSKKKSAS